MRWSEITEALKPSEYRPLVKNWDKERYADIFKNPKYKHDKNGYRVIIPLPKNEEPDEKSFAQKNIERVLAANDFDVVDYRKGIAKNIKNGQEIKIGKVLARLQMEPMLNAFTSDKTREGAKIEDYIAVISRHPYDIAGMSTGRGWTSCMNLNDGVHADYVPLEIEVGSVVAYVTSKDDPDLKNPTGRIMIKPFVNIFNEEEVYFGIENRVYGTSILGFVEAVEEWVNWVNDSHKLDDVAVFELNKKSYGDGMKSSFIRGDNEEASNLKNINDDPFYLFRIKKPTDKEYALALKISPSLLKDMSKQPEVAVYAALKSDGSSIRYVINPTEDMMYTAVSKYGGNIKHIKNPSEDVIEKALSVTPQAFQYVDQNLVSDDLKLSVLTRRPAILRYFDNPSNELIMAAVSKQGDTIEYVKNPTEEQQIAAVKSDGKYAYNNIKNPTPKVTALLKKMQGE